MKSLLVVMALTFPISSQAISALNLDMREELYFKDSVYVYSTVVEGISNYPEIIGKDFPYIIDKLERQKGSKTFFPYSSLISSMAKNLSDREIKILGS